VEQHASGIYHKVSITFKNKSYFEQTPWGNAPRQRYIKQDKEYKSNLHTTQQEVRQQREKA
jgi:hypothetical protein